MDVCIRSIQTFSQDIPLISTATTSSGDISVNVMAGCPTEQCMGRFSVTFMNQQSYIGDNPYSSTTSDYNKISFNFQTR